MTSAAWFIVPKTWIDSLGAKRGEQSSTHFALDLAHGS
jgi:hypothetical protein